jgi:hypothetical protein
MSKKYERLTIKKHRSCNGRDGVAYSCELYFDGVKAAEVVNSGSGGDTDFYFTGADVERRINEYLATLPMEQATPDMEDWQKTLYPRKPDLDDIVAGLCDADETRKKLVRMCRHQTVVRMKDAKAGMVSVFKAEFSPKVKEILVKKYGDRIVEFVNETIL